MKRSWALSSISVLLLVFPAFGQLPVLGFSGGGGNTRDGSFSGSATFRVPLPTFPVVLNAPYSADQATDSSKTLADGTPINRELALNQKTYRDSQGRIRIERYYLSAPSSLKNVPTVVELIDPVAGYVYIMDDVSLTAHRVKLNADGQSSNLTTGSTEDLGSQTIAGVTAHGTRTTRVIPAGAEGNDAPVTVTADVWYSSDLQMSVQTVNTDPRQGTSTSKFTNLIRVEPAPALFQLPANYQVVDETTDFTIRWGAQ